MTDINEQRPKGISRRTIAKGAAWSVPVIATAAATPLAAASEAADTDLGVEFTGSSLDLNDRLVTALDDWHDGLSSSQKLLLGGAYTALKAALQITGDVINVGFDYPNQLDVNNIGATSLDAGEQVVVNLDYGSDVLNVGALSNLANVNAIATSNGANVTVTADSSVPAGSNVTSIPLSYNPITVQVDLTGSDVEAGTATGVLTGDGNPNQNDASSSYGLWVDVLDGLAPLVSAVNALVPLPPLEIDLFT